MPERRMDLVFPTLASACDDVRHLRQVGYELAGTWSFAQILDHLNMSMLMTIEGANFTFPVLLRPLLRIAMMPTLRKGKPSKLRGKAPLQLQPEPNLDEEACAARFYSLADAHMDPATPFVTTYPMLGQLNRDQWLLLQRWHMAHHLSFVIPRT